MNKPLIHPASDLMLSLMMKDLPQSLLLTGPVGVGLGTIARYVGGQIGDVTLTIMPEKDDKIDIEKGVISVDSIRRLFDQTRSIQAGKLVIVIDYAERMGHRAQNAFLKLLEEPGRGVYFILATHTASKLLTTITSRAEIIDIRPITRKQSEANLDALDITDTQRRTQLLFMAEGLPAELSRLTASDVYFEAQATIVRDARDLLQATVYKKLTIAQRYKDNREGTLRLLTTTLKILHRSISQKPSESLIKQIDGILFAYQQIYANGNIRLCLARLAI